MILFEGIDGVGKTTAALEARNALPGWSYRHQTEPSGVGGAWRQQQVLLADAHTRLLVDRLHITNVVYDTIFKGAAVASPHQFRMTELALMSRGCSVIWMTDRLAEVQRRWQAEREMYDFEQMKRVAALFQLFFDGLMWTEGYRTRLPWHQFTLPEFQSKLPELVGLWQARADRAALLPPASVGIGSCDPDFVVLVDDVAPGPPAPSPVKGGAFSDVDLPFGRGVVADWWWRAADELGLQWWMGYYTLASAWTPPMFGHTVTKVLGAGHTPSVVLCLGARSQQLAQSAYLQGWLKGARIQTATHPAYMRGLGVRGYNEWRALVAMALGRRWCDQDNVAEAMRSSGDPDDWDTQNSDMAAEREAAELRRQQQIGGG